MSRSFASSFSPVLSISVCLIAASCAGGKAPAGTLTHVSATPEYVSLVAGGSTQLHLTGTYTDGTTADMTSAAKWTVDYSSIAKLAGAPGLVSAVSEGGCTVTASIEGLNATVSFSLAAVPAPPITILSIKVSNSGSALFVGQNETLIATAEYNTGASMVVTGKARWTSSNAAVASINASGTVTALGPGSTLISAEFGTVTGSTTIDVTTDTHTLAGISIASRPSGLTIGSTFQLNAIGTYTDGTTANVTTQAMWASSDLATATVSAAGMLSVHAAGTASISATLGGFSDEFPLTIGASATPTLSSIAVTPNTVTVSAGATQQLTATGTYSDGSMMVLTAGVTWMSTDVTAAIVNGTGLVTGLTAGMTSITATVGAIKSAAVSVSVSSSMGTGADCNPVINEVQPGVAGDATNEFIELYNPCNASVDVTGWTVNYYATTGTEPHLLVTLNKPIGAHDFVVLGYSSLFGGYTGRTEYTYSSMALSGASGGIELAVAAGGNLVQTVADSMSYGVQSSGLNTYTMGTPAPYTGDTNPPHSIARAVDGVSSGNNSKDFAETSTTTPGEPNVITH